MRVPLLMEGLAAPNPRRPTSNATPNIFPMTDLHPPDPPLPDQLPTPTADVETCDLCGSTDLWWRNCKLLCRNCNAIVKSCADL